ncbi:MAG TPA: cellulose synthase subunit BcsC-related outer membrane protein [Vicinamibacteria bacterium]|nr:cellulose synthase subunit BcsC-related outer membrane protein [Vicinamibacteria bacterium]
MTPSLWPVAVLAALALAETPPPDPPRRYTVEVAVSRSRARLETLAREIEEDAVVIYDAPYYRLFVGAWPDSPTARHAAARLRTAFGRGVVRDLWEDNAHHALLRAPEILTDKNETHFRLVAPDERELWQLLHEGRYDDFRALMDTYLYRYPAWRPAGALEDQLEWLEAEASIRFAEESGNGSALIRLSRAHPMHFDCGGVNRLWTLSEALYSDGFDHEAETQYELILTSCHQGYLLPTLQKASERLPPDVTERLLTEALKRLPTLPANDPARAEVESFEYELRLEETLESEARGDDAAVAVFRRSYGPTVLLRMDESAAALIAWSASRTGELETAEYWFREALDWAKGNTNIVYGLALARIRLGRLDEAVDLAQSFRDIPEIRELMAGALRKAAAESFARGDYRQCLSRLEQSPRFAPNHREEELLRAWSLYHLTRYDDAATVFHNLYAAGADDESAEGLLLSLALGDRFGELDDLGRILGTPFREHWELARANRAIEQRQFLLAERLSGQNFPALQNIDAPVMGGGFASGTRRGGSGFQRLHIERVTVLDALVTVRGTHRLGGRVDRLTLESDVFESGRPLGSSPEPSGEDLPAGMARTSADARFLYYREAPLSLHAELGSTHRAGPIRPRPTFRFGVSRVGEARDWGLDVFSRSVRESLLSSSGLVDPQTRQAWGRVVESGATYHARQRFGADVELLLRASLGRLTGVDVAENWHTDMYAGVERRIDTSSSGQASIGPWLYLSSFRENLSEFTHGHGGYFSPQFHLVGGAVAKFATHEGRRVASRARVSIGYQAYRKRSTPLFPKAPDGRMYEEEKVSGLVYGLDWEGALLMGERWQIAGAVRMDRSADWSELSGTALLRFTLSPRRTLFSRDLDDHPSSRLF